MTYLNIGLNFAIAFAIAWTMRQMAFNRGFGAAAIRSFLALCATTFLAKVLERAHWGDSASVVDCFRDAAVLGLLIVLIGSHRERFGRL